MASHELDYRILGESMQTVEIELDPGGNRDRRGRGDELHDRRHPLHRADGRRLRRQPAGQAVERRQAQARWRVGVHDPLHQRRPGQAARGLCRAPSGQRGGGGPDDVGGRLFCQKDSFLCAAYGTRVGIAFTKRLGAGFFGGEGFILQKLEGDGLVFVHAGGTLIRRQLNGETLRVDTGCLVAFTDGIDYDVQLAGGLKSMLFGGEGLLLTTLKGSGTVWLQSLPFSRLAGRIYDATFRAREEVRTNNG